LPTEASYPYTAADGYCQTYNLSANVSVKVGTVISHVLLPRGNKSALMNAVVSKGPIAISVAAYPWQSYESGVFNCGQYGNVDHAVQLVGYGTDAALGDYWQVRNSWGASWGEAGYIRILRHGATGPEPCLDDTDPQGGFACKGDPTFMQVCGECGILSGSSYPIYNTNRPITFPHYENPSDKGGHCLADETVVSIKDVSGRFCGPLCNTTKPCPPVPAGVGGDAQCVANDDSACAVICVPGALDDGCMKGATCQPAGGAGVCTYPVSDA
jgi:hypothetical protein